MTPAVGVPGNHEGVLAFHDARVRNHVRPPPSTVPPRVAARKPRVFASLRLSKTRGLPAAAPASAPSPAPRSTSKTRYGEACTAMAREPAASRPAPAP